MVLPLSVCRILSRLAAGQFELDDETVFPEPVVVLSGPFHSLPHTAQGVQVPFLPGEEVEIVILITQLDHPGLAVCQHVLQGRCRIGLELILLLTDLLGTLKRLTGKRMHGDPF
jgi:hypothetical protein